MPKDFKFFSSPPVEPEEYPMARKFCGSFSSKIQ